ncbi:MAG: hypothetical protein JSV66_04120 [Trueperaceae bacterium]|nr:MAG: hypothetical protein JSV66_04120 [Trueperaceae bacterium]
MTLLPQTAELEQQLNDFDPSTRKDALDTLLRMEIEPPGPAREVANMHCHTFFSFNAYGHSPTSLAWLGRQRGIGLMGTVDFDVLDAVDEFLDACELTGVRGSTGIETRTYFPEFADFEMNSPGEPGILYHMGIGFSGGEVSPKAARILSELCTQSAQRNLDVIERLNDYLDPVKVDYPREVLTLTPKGTATERHIVLAYIHVAKETFGSSQALGTFWAEKLQLPADDLPSLMADEPGFQNLVRSKLIKRGGIAYVQPSWDSFPPLEHLHELILECQALPCAAWLDGTTNGEQKMSELLELLVAKGAVALNLVPDRSWNLPNQEEKRLKLDNLYQVVELARTFDLPLNVGTEMNSFGQKIVDDFDAPELAPVRQAFIDGAYFVYGHTVMQRKLTLGYQSAWANAYLPTRKDRNEFYTALGRLATPGGPVIDRLNAVTDAMTPGNVLAHLT